MMDGLQYMHVPHKSINNFVYISSPNLLSPAFRGTFRETSSPAPRQDPVNRDPTFGTFMVYSFVSRFAKAIAEAPVVRVKFLLQNQGELIKSGRLSTPYKGITNCFARIIKNEGVLSLWRGNSAQFLQIIPSQVLDIVFTVTFRNVVYNFKRDTDGKQNWIFGNSVAITAASASTLLFTHPLGYAHTRLASDIKCVKTGGDRQFNGLIDVWRKTLRSDGVRGFYRGFNVGCLGLILGKCPNMLRQKRDPSKPLPKSTLARSFLVGVAFMLAAHPCDTVSRRMMMTSGETVKYKSSIDAFAQIIQNEGIKSLYKGFGANMLRVVPLISLAVALKKWGDHNGPSTSISVALQTN